MLLYKNYKKSERGHKMRKRMIDPGYWSDDKVIELQPEQRLLFIGMWNFADDSGVLKNSPKQLKHRYFLLTY